MPKYLPSPLRPPTRHLRLSATTTMEAEAEVEAEAEAEAETTITATTIMATTNMAEMAGPVEAAPTSTSPVLERRTINTGHPITTTTFLSLCRAQSARTIFAAGARERTVAWRVSPVPGLRHAARAPWTWKAAPERQASSAGHH